MCTKNLEQKTCLGKHNHGVVGLHNLKIHEACCQENPVWQAETADQIQNSRQLPFIPNQRLTVWWFSTKNKGVQNPRGAKCCGFLNISPPPRAADCEEALPFHLEEAQRRGDGEIHPWETKDSRLDAKLPI